MQCCAAFRPVENNKHPNLNGGERGVVWIVLFSEVLLFDNNVSTVLICRRLWVFAKIYRTATQEKMRDFSQSNFVIQ